MTAPTIADYLKYANLQMVAEAFLKISGTEPGTWVERYSGDDLVNALKAGNNRNSRFTESEAKKFADDWIVLDQKPNTATGFSATLFESKGEPKQYVISFRSTEFIDDAVNDCQVTNKTIKDFGWGFGQIADMG